MECTSNFGNYSICRKITSEGKFVLIVSAVDTKIIYCNTFDSYTWKYTAGNKTMEEMYEIINLCKAGDDIDFMNTMNNNIGDGTYFLRLLEYVNDDALSMNIFFRELGKERCFFFKLPLRTKLELNDSNSRLLELIHHFKMVLEGDSMESI
jgi:hypothetical protein